MNAATGQKGQVIAVLRHRDDAFGEGTASNTIAALSQARMNYATFDISDPLPDLGPFTVVLMCTERLGAALPETAATLEHFVKQGGGLVVLHRSFQDEFCGLFGLLQQDRSAAARSDYDAAGLHFPSCVLPSFAGIKLDATVMDGHAAFDVIPSENARVVATTWTGKPLSWRTKIGQGYVLYWNTTIFGASRTRGLILESLTCVVPVSVVPLANAGVVQVDDFPAPLAAPPEHLIAPAQPDTFYSHVWWPDIHGLADRYDIPLSSYVMFDYADSGAEGHLNPFSMIESENLSAIKRVPPAEIGLHGYNHIPLSRDHWPDRAKMVQSVERAVAEWTQAGLGPLPTSYVPPMNVCDADGTAALVSTIPELTVISGYLSGTMGGPTHQEFGPDPNIETLFNLPRATSGHECSAELLFDCANVVAALGVWTHFLHPDDLMDVPVAQPGPDAPRNPFGRSWRDTRGQQGLYSQVATIFSQVRGRFPWMVFRTTTDAAKTVRAFLDSAWKIEIGMDKVVFEGPVGGYVRLRTNGSPPGRIVACDGAEVLHHQCADDYNLYVLRARATRVEITLTREAPAQPRLERIFGALRAVRRQAAS